MENTSYQATIIDSTRKFTGREAIRIKDTANHIAIQDMQDGDQIGPVKAIFAIAIHNEKSENTDYEVFVFELEDGKLCSTSSESFYRSARDIWDEIVESGDTEPITYILRLGESSTVKGKNYFRACLL